MTEPNENATVWMRFDAAGNAVDSHDGEMVPRADFDRLRDERDRAIEQRENANRASVRVELELARLRTERDELRRAVGRDRSTPYRGRRDRGRAE